MLFRKRIHMVAGVKVSYLAGKCVFYRPEHNAKGRPQHANFEGLEMQKLNIPPNTKTVIDFLLPAAEIKENGRFFTF